MSLIKKKTPIRGMSLLFFMSLFLCYINTVSAGDITLAWDPNDVAVQSYYLYARIPEESYNFERPVATLSHESCRERCEVTFEIEPNTAYFFTIKAMDINGSSETSEEIPFKPEDFPNSSPVANAGTDQTVKEETQIFLTASDSYDPDGLIVSYRWVQISGGTIAITQADGITASVVTPNVDSNGTALVFELTVTDNCGSQSKDTVIVNVTHANIPPVAEAGEEQNVLESSLVTIRGSGSADSDGSIVSYEWKQLSGTPADLQNANLSTATFIAPDVNSNGDLLIFSLSVTDNGGLKASDQVAVRISYINREPVASAGNDQSITEGQKIFLDGSLSSDPDGTIAGYRWQQLSGPFVVLTSAQTSVASFSAPFISKEEENLIFSLTVMDNGNLEATDVVNILISHTNLPPTASAGPDQTVTVGDAVTLNGTGSHDTDGNILSYLWAQTQGPSVTILQPETLISGFETSHLANTRHILSFRLTVTDNKGSQAEDTLTITVNSNDSETEPDPDEETSTSPDIDSSVPEEPVPPPNGGGSMNMSITPSIHMFRSDAVYKEWRLLAWSSHDNLNGESRIATGDVDGDGKDELIIGLDKDHAADIQNGIFEVLDDDFSHLAWGKIDWEDYNTINGESIPAAGDLDGDGKDEILIGLGKEGAGKIEVFSFNEGVIVHKDWITLDWSDYNAAIGKTRPAVGDVDGDMKDEIIIGLAPQEFEDLQPGGLFRLLDSDYTSIAWGELNWSEYNTLNGETFPSTGDIDGDGFDDIIIGLGEGGGGKLSYFTYDPLQERIIDNGWIEINWGNHGDTIRTTRPALGDFDGDSRDELIVGFGHNVSDSVNKDLFFITLNDDYLPLSGVNVAGENFPGHSGESYPLSGDFNGDGVDEIMVGLGDNLWEKPPALTNGESYSGNKENASGGGGGGCFISVIFSEN